MIIKLVMPQILHIDRFVHNVVAIDIESWMVDMYTSLSITIIII